METLVKRKRLQNIRSNLKTKTIFQTNTRKIENSNFNQNSAHKKKFSFNSSEGEINERQKEAQQITSETIAIFESKYQLLEKLGQGANGVVRKCREIKSGIIYAVKISPIDEQHILALRQSFKIVKKLNHPNIVKYKEIYMQISKHTCYLVMEYIAYESLRKYKDLKEKEIKSIIAQLLTVIQYLHAQKICHRDIKPDNILFNREANKIILIDFGISKKIMDRGKIIQMWSPTGTLHYKAPEMLTGGGYHCNVDTWAVGVILYELITGEVPFFSQFLSDEIEKIVNIEYKLDEIIWSQYSKFTKDLVQKLLRPQNTRFTPKEALRTAWFLQDSQTNLKSQNLVTKKNFQQDENFIFQRNNTRQYDAKFELERNFSMNTNINLQILQQILKIRQSQQDIITQ